MSIARKKGLVCLLLAVVLIWPLAHRVLVAQVGLNPWKFFGFAMYCVPSLKPQVRVHVNYGGRVERLDLSAPHLFALRVEVASFVRERGLWGRLVEPDGVAAAVFDVLSRAKSLEVEVIDPFFDLETSKISVTRVRHAYP